MSLDGQGLGRDFEVHFGFYILRGECWGLVRVDGDTVLLCGLRLILLLVVLFLVAGDFCLTRFLLFVEFRGLRVAKLVLNGIFVDG